MIATNGTVSNSLEEEEEGPGSMGSESIILIQNKSGHKQSN